jgi:thymidylate kinase
MNHIELELITELHKRINDCITYCYWKSTDHIKATLRGDTDLDILICKNNVSRFEKEISSLGFKELKTVHLRSYPGIKDFIGLDNQSGKWVHIHAHYTLNLGDRWVKSYHLPIEREILKRRYFDNNLNIFLINPKDEMFLFRIRMSLKFLFPYRRTRVLREEEYLRKLIESLKYSENQYITTPLNEIINSLDKIGNLPRNLQALRLRIGLKFFRRFNRLKFSIYSKLRMFYRYYIEFRRRVLSNYDVGRRTLSEGGLIIVLTGIDGSGKTSNVIALEKFLKIQLNTTRVFMGYGSSGANWMRRLIFTIYGKKRRKNIKKNISNNDERRITILYAIWILVCLFDKKKNLKKAMKARANGNIVLADRWPQRKIKGTFDGARLEDYKGSNKIIKIIKAYERKIISLSEFANPDLVIKLIIDPKTSTIRKPGELSLMEASRLMDIFKELNWNCDNQIQINAEQDEQIIQSELKKLIWNHLNRN